MPASVDDGVEPGRDPDVLVERTPAGGAAKPDLGRRGRAAVRPVGGGIECRFPLCLMHGSPLGEIRIRRTSLSALSAPRREKRKEKFRGRANRCRLRAHTVVLMGQPESSSYIIRGGEIGRARLRLLSRVMWPTTEALFRRVGIRRDAICLDVGGGDVTVELRRLAADGAATGVDVDMDQLDRARTEASPAGLLDIEFRYGRRRRS